MADQLMHPVEVAERWRISAKTLAQWRWQGKGPRFVKLGGRVMYAREDVERHEAELRACGRERGLA